MDEQKVVNLEFEAMDEQESVNLDEKDESCQVAANLLYWRIINLRRYDEISTYLNRKQITNVNNIFNNSVSPVLESVANTKAGTVLKTFELLTNADVVEISRTVISEGAVGGLRKLSNILDTLDYEAPVLDENKELRDILGDDTGVSVDNSDFSIENANEIAQLLLSEYESSGTLNMDVKYIFDLFGPSFAMIEDRIPLRENTERNLNLNYYFQMYSCFKSVCTIHYGEAVSRSSRFRRRWSGSEKAEGYHVDFLFTARKAESGFGDEFALAENIGSNNNPSMKLTTVTDKMTVTLRDTYFQLSRKLLKNTLVSSNIQTAMDFIRIIGSRTSGFAVSTSVLIPGGGGLFICDELDSVLVPTKQENIKDNIDVARAMLNLKGILSRTVANFDRIKTKIDIKKRQKRTSVGKPFQELPNERSPVKKKSKVVKKVAKNRAKSGAKKLCKT
ncbi:hypothetical protein HK098_004763 [Nowakowskiella sp. JEL0407]|nr:hypothetical protein HK098_004763 [Nowakowskiella sp. JEL0407]